MSALPASTDRPPAVRHFGRFELQRPLGEGAQATVWLGFDSRLERPVAVKLMRAGAVAHPAAVGEWLSEARSVSRLTHPNIVPVFEADVLEQQAYLVFEYVAGPTLAQHLKQRGTLPANEACALMLGVLEALQAAHGAGVVHRDLKPSNILVDATGRARVMDFGIAARLHEPGGGEIVGTPGYMSPEATRGGRPTASMDLYSVGLMLVELLSGARLISERDPYRAMARAAEEDLVLPATLAAEVDDVLRSVLRRAIARDPAQRWPSAAAFRDALQAWMAPAPVAATGGAAHASGTLEFLLRRMRHKSDFPALSDSVVRIQRVADSDNESLASLSSEILKDVALTNKLLRMVNTATFSSEGGRVSTVSRAVALVGFANVRNMAMSLVLLEHMHDKAHANQLKEEFLRSLLAGMVASELGAMVRDSEEAFIGAMFQNLGRLLTEYYFPEEARQIRGIVAGSGQPGSVPVSEATASMNVLGLPLEQLGLGVARAWGLPASLQGCLRKPEGEPPSRPPKEAAERLRWLTHTANQVADSLLRSEPAQATARIREIARNHARVLDVSPQRIETASSTARHRLTHMAQAMGLYVPAHSPARRLFADGAVSGHATTVRLDPDPDSLTPHALEATMTMAQAPRVDTPDDATHIALDLSPAALGEKAADLLAAGIQDITNTMVEDFKLNDVLRMILETMYRALGFRRIVFCLRDAKTNTLTGRFGLGEGATAVAASFKVPLRPDAGLFAAVCLRGADTMIADATMANIHARLPDWFRRDVNAPSFLLLPMMMKGAPFALIYADKATPGGVALGDKELSLLRTLRNQAVMAFKQAG